MIGYKFQIFVHGGFHQPGAGIKPVENEVDLTNQDNQRMYSFNMYFPMCENGVDLFWGVQVGINIDTFKKGERIDPLSCQPYAFPV